MTNIRTHLINEISQNISNIIISKNDMGQLLRDFRSLIEIDNTTANYKILYFYCNWAAHPNVNRNKELYQILEKINIGFAELPIKNSESNKKYNDYIDVIIDALNFNSLIENIHLLLFSIDAIDKLKSKKLLLPICQNLVLRKIHYPDYLFKNDVKKNETVLKMAKIHERIDKVEKFLDPSLDSTLDYSKPVIIKSLLITEVKNNEVFVELEIDSEKHLKIKSSIRLT